ncbi:uncharacterized protein LOC134288294 [Aedes albopictus]|uniref:Uncharacterized protein n=1 Tax=Aedes albopictus TaxID=7160 RepID=A0ABM1Y9B5_AEDAL
MINFSKSLTFRGLVVYDLDLGKFRRLSLGSVIKFKRNYRRFPSTIVHYSIAACQDFGSTIHADKVKFQINLDVQQLRYFGESLRPSLRQQHHHRRGHIEKQDDYGYLHLPVLHSALLPYTGTRFQPDQLVDFVARHLDDFGSEEGSCGCGRPQADSDCSDRPTAEENQCRSRKEGEHYPQILVGWWSRFYCCNNLHDQDTLFA